jgi:eukaryotic-like serine/threonine-protein kinase
MSTGASGSISFDDLAESFVARLRKGERPAICEYVERYPKFADEILELFPALAEMEGLKSEPDNATGSFEKNGATGSLGADLPNQLGDYRILRRIGQGGMGVVYEARRESLSAHVALKVLHHHFRSDDSFLRRFRNEARSAARLHHTNIVPVYDFGEQGGILYYVMQYIAGQGLDRVMADVRRLREDEAPAPPAMGDTQAQLARAVSQGLFTGQFVILEQGPSAKERGSSATELGVQSDVPMTTGGKSQAPPSPEESDRISALGGASTGQAQARYHREIARIGAQVADGLAHAHSLGVLHRDIKPSNLLLDARGNAWVTDFGLAKCEGGEGNMTA